MSGGSAPDDADCRAVHARSLRNRGTLSHGGPCGCFYCLAVFDAAEVRDWIGDTTARCPRCGIDAVLSARDAPIDQDFLRRMREHWFGRAVRWNPSTPWPPRDAS